VLIIRQVRSGVKFGDGDGTIPVISLGSMCVKGWKGKTKWNPAGIEVVTQGEWNMEHRCGNGRAEDATFSRRLDVVPLWIRLDPFGSWSG
jgi:hypothetical protein